MAKFCTSCGTQNSDDAGFCAACGHPFEPAPVAAAAVAPPQSPAPEPPQPVQPEPTSQPLQPATLQPAVAPQQMYPPVAPAVPQQPAPAPAPAAPAPVAPAAAPAAPQPAPQLPQKKRRVPLAVKIIIPIAVALILVVVGLVLAVTIPLSNAAKADYYTIGADRIPSVKLALGQIRKVTSTSVSTSGGVTTKVIKYQVSGTSQNKDMSAYMVYLHDKDGFYTLTDIDFSPASATGGLGRNSKDNGQELLLQIEYDTSGYTITIVKEKGEITPNGGGDTTTNSDQSSATTGASKTPALVVQPGWIREESSDPPVWNKGDASISLSVNDVSGSTQTHQQWVKARMDDMKAVYGANQVSDAYKGTLGGLEAWQFSYTDGTLAFRQVFIFDTDGKTMYEIDTHSRTDDKGEIATEIEDTIDTFYVTP